MLCKNSSDNQKMIKLTLSLDFENPILEPEKLSNLNPK